MFIIKEIINNIYKLITKIVEKKVIENLRRYTQGVVC
jgi:hypothetical protein